MGKGGMTARAPIDMVSPTDALAMRRVGRLFRRMIEESDRHLANGHGAGCPFTHPETRREIEFLADCCEMMIVMYEKVHGPVDRIVSGLTMMQPGRHQA